MSDARARRGASPAPIGGIVDSVVQSLLPPTATIAAGSLEARARRSMARELERQIERALWRADRRSRRVPRHVRQSSSWVHGQRRRMAYEISRALVSLGAGRELARTISEHACQRFPRDGVIFSDDELRADRPERPRRPRLEGTAPRQLGTNPRAIGGNPRARGQSPRQQRSKPRENPPHAGDL